MNLSELDAIIQQYETVLQHLRETLKSPTDSPAPVLLEVLTIRDRIQSTLDAIATSPDRSLPSGAILDKLNQLDKTLREQAADIAPFTQSAEWRASFNPNEKSWWWFLAVPKSAWSDRIDWLRNTVAITCLTVSLGLIGDIAPRFLTGTPDSFGAITISTQSVLTLLVAGGALTKTGQEILKRRPNLGVIGSILLMLSFIVLRYSLPQIATHFYTHPGRESRVKGDWGTAEEQLKRAIQLNTDDAEAHFQLGILYEDLLQTDQARSQYQLAIQGGIPAATNNLARLNILKKDYPAAVSLLLKASLAHNLDPRTQHAVLKNLGWARLMQKNYPDAEAKLKQAIALEIPKNKLEKDEIAAPHCLLAQVKEAQGDKKAALVDWNTCNRFANPTIPEQDGWRIVAQKRIAQSLNQK
jgi:tetratricopeptide (TPR) repeat protein